MSATSEFTVDGRRFELRHLSPEDACLGVETLGKTLGPAAVELFVGDGVDFKNLTPAQLARLAIPLIKNATGLSALLKLFAPVAKFDRGGNGILVDLQPFTDEVFGGRLDVLLVFLVNAVRAEFAIFLGGGGALVPFLEQVVGKSASPKAPTA
jgi:hypothetical protein